MQPLGKTVWSFLEKLKPELPYDRAFSLLGLYPNKIDLEDTSVFPSSFPALFSTGKARKQPVWVGREMWCLFTMECPPALPETEIPSFATTRVTLGGVVLSEISQTEEDRQRMASLISGI